MRRSLYLLLLLVVCGVAWPTGFGTDTRQLPSWTLPYRCAGKMARPEAWGSGVLVGPDLFLTCGHVVLDPKTDQLYPGLKVQMGFGEHPQLEAEVLEAFWPHPTDFAAGSGMDCAIVRLNRPLGLYYGWLPCSNLSDKELLHQKIEFVGYGNNQEEKRPEFAGAKNPWVSPGQVRETAAHVFGHDCSGWAGSSGGPLLSLTEPCAVLGVFSAAVGPGQDGGFLDAYKLKEAGNLGVPARNWADVLSKIPEKKYPALRRVEVRNSNRATLAVRVRYRSIWKDADVVTAPALVHSNRKEVVLALEDGFSGQEIWMQTQSLARSGTLKEDPAPLEEQWGEYRRYYVGGSGDHVLFLR